MVPSDPVTPEDFVPHFDRYPDREWPDPIAARALSVFTDDDDIPRLQRRLKVFRTRINLKAVGILEPHCGKMVNTPSHEASHHDWWKPVDVDATPLFSVVREEG